MAVSLGTGPKVAADYTAFAGEAPGGLFAQLEALIEENQAIVTEVLYKVDVNTLHKVENDHEFGMNEIGRVSLRVSQPVFYDTYRRNRNTGSFILVDPFGNETLGAGMLR